MLFLIISSTVLAKQGQLKNYEITTFKIYERKRLDIVISSISIYYNPPPAVLLVEGASMRKI